jgi:hypothetical protein
MSVEFTIPSEVFSPFRKQYYIPSLQGNLKTKSFNLQQYFPGYSVSEFNLHVHKVELTSLKMLNLFPFFPTPDPITQSNTRFAHLRGCLCSLYEEFESLEFESFIVIDKKDRRVYVRC